MERNLFEHEREKLNLLLASKIGNFWSNNYIEYKSNGDRNQTLLVEKSFPGLAWQKALRNTKEKLDLITGIDMLLMVQKVVRGEICFSIC